MGSENEFCIKFDTQPGNTIKAVQVTLEEVILTPTDVVRVNLSDHPLYPALVEYMMNNMGQTTPPTTNTKN